MEACSVNIVLHDDVQLMNWGESRTAGPWIKLRLTDSEKLNAFRGLDISELRKSQHILRCTLVDGDILETQETEEVAKEKAPYGAQARELRLSSFFLRPDVWKAVGTDAEYREWIQTQTSCLDHDADWDPDIGASVCEAAHVRRSGEFGTGYKGEYACVPLTHAQHQMLHSKEGELGVIQKYRPHEDIESVESAKAWFDKERVWYVQSWCWQSLREQLGWPHWNQIAPYLLRDWANENDLHNYLPACYKEP